MKGNKTNTNVTWSMYGEQMTDAEARAVVMLYDLIDGSERFFLVTLGSVDATILTDSAEDFVSRNADVFDRYESNDKGHLVGIHTVRVRNFCPEKVLGLLSETKRKIARSYVLTYLGFTPDEASDYVSAAMPVEEALWLRMSSGKDSNNTLTLPAPVFFSKDYHSLFAVWLAFYENVGTDSIRIADYLVRRGIHILRNFVKNEIPLISPLREAYEKIVLESIDMPEEDNRKRFDSFIAQVENNESKKIKN